LVAGFVGFCFRGFPVYRYRMDYSACEGCVRQIWLGSEYDARYAVFCNIYNSFLVEILAMIEIRSKEDIQFTKRLDELCERSKERYSPEFTSFLDGRLLRYTESYLGSVSDTVLVSFGGFNGAERCVVGIFPEELYGSVPKEELKSYFEISGVEIRGSGFSAISHRDIMGSVLALGVKRETMGDIYVPENSNCGYVCMTSVAARYVCDNLEFVSRDKVKCSLIPVSQLPTIERKFSVISGTVASDRLDCVVSLAARISREKSKGLIVSGFVNVNHEPVDKSDFSVEDGDILSIRGYGRFVISEIGGLTKKGRSKTIIHKMI